MPHPKRQALIDKYGLNQTTDETLNNLISSIAQLFDVPVAMTAIAQKGHFVFQSRYGLDIDTLSLIHI